MTKHVHHDMIVEWAKDPSRVVQYRRAASGEWRDTGNRTSPQWYGEFEYRFKPEPKPDVVQKLLVTPAGWYENAGNSNLRLTFSGEDGRLLKAEVLE